MLNIVGDLLFSLPVKNQLGEGVQWYCETQSIWWLDIEGACLFSYSAKDQKTTKYTMPERVGSFCFIKNDKRLLIAFESGFAFYDIASDNIEWLARPELDKPGNRFNDGRVDRLGNFWAGTMIQSPSEDSKKASLYKFSSRNEQVICEKVLSDMIVSNGLCFSLDNNIIYHADSPTRQIQQYQYDQKTGQLINKTLLCTTEVNSYPDGSAIDSEGYLWNAQWGGSRVVRYSPEGEVDFILPVPIIQPSCVAIGGPSMDWLIITSAQEGLTPEQLKHDTGAGNVFIYQLNGVTGIEENQFLL